MDASMIQSMTKGKKRKYTKKLYIIKSNGGLKQLSGSGLSLNYDFRGDLPRIFRGAGETVFFGLVATRWPATRWPPGGPPPSGAT